MVLKTNSKIQIYIKPEGKKYYRQGDFKIPNYPTSGDKYFAKPKYDGVSDSNIFAIDLMEE